MSYKKQIVCLANSRKHSGSCVAGIEIVKGQLGEWVRPISNRKSEELSLLERRYENGTEVQVLDIVDIRLVKPHPHACQTENHVIDDTSHWQHQGRFKAKSLVPTAVTDPPLWIDGYKSYSGINDRIPIAQADKLKSSLLLVIATKPVVKVGKGLKRRQVRIEFTLGEVRYRLAVTDPRIEASYLAKDDGDYVIDSRVLMCVSLGEPHEGYRYKLAASVIPVR